MPPPSLILPLFGGPIDVVGDVHAEIEPLMALLHHLGYSEKGVHPDGRRLVFLGDLTDRGPDSLAVVDLVTQLMDRERVQCVLGNHELNLLLDKAKYDNGWFYGRPFVHEGQVIDQQLADDAGRARADSLFRRLPLALEREDLRVVHACWDDAMVSEARRATDAVELYRQYAERIDRQLAAISVTEPAGRDLHHQNENPVKVLTSGPERGVPEPFFAGGKVRKEERVPWWQSYAAPVTCVFGHYTWGRTTGKA